MDRRRALSSVAAAMALVEVVMVFSTEFWPAALLMAVIFGGCAWRLAATDRGRTAVVVVLVAFLVELLPLPFFPREGLADWIPQVATGLLSLAGVVLAVALLRPRRQSVAA